MDITVICPVPERPFSSLQVLEFSSTPCFPRSTSWQTSYSLHINRSLFLCHCPWTIHCSPLLYSCPLLCRLVPSFVPLSADSMISKSYNLFRVSPPVKQFANKNHGPRKIQISIYLPTTNTPTPQQCSPPTSSPTPSRSPPPPPRSQRSTTGTKPSKSTPSATSPPPRPRRPAPPQSGWASATAATSPPAATAAATSARAPSSTSASAATRTATG